MHAVLWGFGQLGRAIASAAGPLGCEIAAVVDRDPALSGRAVPELPPSSRTGAPLLFHATTSKRADTVRQILDAIGAGYSVVSAAEWLFNPWLRHAEEAARIDEAARAAGVRVTGIGINPGFIFDTLPLLLAATIGRIETITIRRISNVSGEGPAGLSHLGLGLSLDAFADRLATGTVEGHMGFPESIAAIAERLSLPIDRITDTLEPTPAVRPLHLPTGLFSTGEVVGITQIGRGLIGDRVVIDNRLEMFLDPEGYGRTPHEVISIEGDHPLELTLKPAALPADGAAAMMIHAGRVLDRVAPGFVSALDLPIRPFAAARYGRPALR